MMMMMIAVSMDTTQYEEDYQETTKDHVDDEQQGFDCVEKKSSIAEKRTSQVFCIVPTKSSKHKKAGASFGVLTYEQLLFR